MKKLLFLTVLLSVSFFSTQARAEEHKLHPIESPGSEASGIYDDDRFVIDIYRLNNHFLTDWFDATLSVRVSLEFEADASRYFSKPEKYTKEIKSTALYDRSPSIMLDYSEIPDLIILGSEINKVLGEHYDHSIERSLVLSNRDSVPTLVIEFMQDGKTVLASRKIKLGRDSEDVTAIEEQYSCSTEGRSRLWLAYALDNGQTPATVNGRITFKPAYSFRTAATLAQVQTLFREVEKLKKRCDDLEKENERLRCAREQEKQEAQGDE